MSDLSLREREVMDLFVSGLTSLEIGKRLVISARTVENHLNNIKDKSGIGNRILLAIWWHDCGGLTA